MSKRKTLLLQLYCLYWSAKSAMSKEWIFCGLRSHRNVTAVIANRDFVFMGTHHYEYFVVNFTTQNSSVWFINRVKAWFILPKNAIRMLTSQIRNEIRSALSCGQLTCEYRSEGRVVTSNSHQICIAFAFAGSMNRALGRCPKECRAGHSCTHQ